MAALLQREHAAALARQLADRTARVRALRALDPVAMAWSPPGGGWSAGQVVEHLLVTDGSYLPKLRTLVADPAAPRAAADAVWKPSLVGGLLVRSLESPRKLPAPKPWRITAPARTGVVDLYLAQLEETAALLARATPLDWRRIRTSSPLSRLVRMNLGDVFTVLVTHVGRHLGQIERVQAARLTAAA